MDISLESVAIDTDWLNFELTHHLSIKNVRLVEVKTIIMIQRIALKV